MWGIPRWPRRHALRRPRQGGVALFGSTSPSYLILLSIDLLLPHLADGSIAAELAATAARVNKLAAQAADRGFLLPAGPVLPTRLALGFRRWG